jgi:hypothetical protein
LLAQQKMTVEELSSLLYHRSGLLGISVLAILLSRSKSSTAVVYGATLAICAVGLAGSLRSLGGVPMNGSTVTLPIGLPWLGAHFRLDALSAAFLIIVNLAATAPGATKTATSGSWGVSTTW